MYQSVSTQNPTVYIGLNKNRIKVYDQNKVFLEDCEFQLELFNSTQDTILAKIYLNNKSISQNGLVLRPGERVWLDRYLDEQRKFKFSQYEVDTSDPEVRQAIKDNGKVKIEFYKQSQLDYNTITITNPQQPYTPWPWFPTYPSYPTWYTTCETGTTTNTYNIDNLTLTDTQNYNNCSHTSTTGIIEKGADSNQKLTNVNLNFNYLPFHTIEYQILPITEKNFVTETDIKKYCTTCGSRIRKPQWQYCPTCGGKL